MKSDRGRDNDRIESGAVEQMAQIFVPLHLRIQGLEMGQPLLAGIAHELQVAIRQLTKIPDQIGSPVPTPDNSNVYLVFHITSRVPPCSAIVFFDSPGFHAPVPPAPVLSSG